MELKDFIKHTLADIVKGTLAASEELKEDVALCCHTNKEYHGYPSVSYVSNMREKQAPVTVVGFKVRIEVEDTAEADGCVGGGLLNVVSGRAKGGISHASGTEHEVTFSVPLVWKQKGR
mgnify:CR=1 FL=1